MEHGTVSNQLGGSVSRLPRLLCEENGTPPPTGEPTRGGVLLENSLVFLMLLGGNFGLSSEILVIFSGLRVCAPVPLVGFPSFPSFSSL